MNTTTTEGTGNTMKTIEGYLIRPATRTVHPVTINSQSDNQLAAMYALIGCDCVDVVRLTEDQRIDCWVDDEGLLKADGPDGAHYFAILVEGQGMQTLCGNGLVLGCDNEGNSTTPKVFPEAVLQCVRFYDPTAGDSDAVLASVTRPFSLSHRVTANPDGTLTEAAPPAAPGAPVAHAAA